MMVIICHVERRWHFLAGLVVDQHNVEVNALQMHGLASKFLPAAGAGAARAEAEAGCRRSRER